MPAVAADWLRPAERGSAVVSMVLYPRWVRFFFLEGVAIDGPERRLEGPATRSARSAWARAAILDDPCIRGLMAQALTVAGADLKTGSGQVVLKSTIASNAETFHHQFAGLEWGAIVGHERHDI